MVWQKLTQQIKTFNEKSPGFLESEKKSRENHQGISIRTVTSIRKSYLTRIRDFNRRLLTDDCHKKISENSINVVCGSVLTEI